MASLSSNPYQSLSRYSAPEVAAPGVDYWVHDRMCVHTAMPPPSGGPSPLPVARVGVAEGRGADTHGWPQTCRGLRGCGDSLGLYL
jgi:hypothetical protein